MNILIMNTFYYPNMRGGTEDNVKLLAEYLAASGQNVLVYSYDGVKGGPYYEIVNNVKVHRRREGLFRNEEQLKKNVFFWPLWLMLKFITFTNLNQNDLRMLIKEFKPDVVYTNNMFRFSTYAWKVIHKMGIPLIHTVHDCWLYYSRTEKKGFNLLKPIRSIQRKRSSEYVDLMTAPSQYIINLFSKEKFFFHRPKVCLENCIMLDLPETKKIILEKQARTADAVKFLFVGGFTYMKGLDRLLEEFSVLGDQCSLSICGNGPLLEQVLSFSNKNKRIHYLGFLNKKELKEKYIESDVVMVPSRCEESFGKVIIEGMQYGNMVIVSNRGGMPEIIKAMHSGAIFDDRDKSAMINEMQQAMSRDYIRKNLQNIPEYISMYGLDAIGDKFLDYCNRVVKK